MIDIRDLTVTQSGFRNEKQIQGMVDFLTKENGRFNLGSLAEHNGNDLRLINIVRFEDNRLYIHDGHHRIVAMYLANRKFVFGNEYEVKEWRYEDYIAINFDRNWVTPFDPRTEVRVADYTHFKNTVNSMLTIDNSRYKGPADRAYIESWIRSNKHRYAEARKVLTIQDMLKAL